MHETDAPNNVAGQYSETPGPGLEGTRLSADAANAFQNEIVNAVQGAGLTLNKADNTQLRQAIPLLATSQSGIRNLFLNGNCALWQRATSFALTGSDATVYTADRWACNADSSGGNGTATISRQEEPPGNLYFPGGHGTYLRHLQTVGATITLPGIQQTIEGIEHFDSQEVTLSFWARGDVTLNATLIITQAYGSGGSGDNQLAAIAFNMVAGWNRYEFNVTVGSLLGKAIGAGSGLRCKIAGQMGTTYTMEVTSLQAEFGGSATQFTWGHGGLDELMSKRYFEKSYELEVVPGTVTDVGALAGVAGSSAPADELGTLDRTFVASKAVIPTMTWYAPSNGAAGNIDDRSDPSNSIVTSVMNTSRERTGYPVATVGASAQVRAHFTADAEII